jgi:hypothetical protein
MEGEIVWRCSTRVKDEKAIGQKAYKRNLIHNIVENNVGLEKDVCCKSALFSLRN